MKRLLPILALTLSVLPQSVEAQIFGSPTSRFRIVSALPATCNKGEVRVLFGDDTQHNCVAGVWVAVAGGAVGEVTLAGVQSLSNKTLPSPVFSGTVLGTYTLGGTPSIAATALTGTIAAARMPALIGDVTSSAGSAATTIASTLISGKTLVTAATNDQLLISDTSDSGNLKRATIQSLLDQGISLTQAQTWLATQTFGVNSADIITLQQTVNFTVGAVGGYSLLATSNDRSMAVTNNQHATTGSIEVTVTAIGSMHCVGYTKLTALVGMGNNFTPPNFGFAPYLVLSHGADSWVSSADGSTHLWDGGGISGIGTTGKIVKYAGRIEYFVNGVLRYTWTNAAAGDLAYTGFYSGDAGGEFSSIRVAASGEVGALPVIIKGDTTVMAASAKLLEIRDQSTLRASIDLEGGGFFRSLNVLPITAPANPASGGVLYVDTADGDLKVKFSNGTVVVLAAN